MAVALNDTPRRSDLEDSFARERSIGHALVVLLLLLDVAMIVRLILMNNAAVLVLAGILLLLSAGIHIASLLRYFNLPKQRVRHLPLTRRIGQYSTGQIKRIVSEVLRPYRSRELPTIYITEAKHDGAHVINSLLFNFLRPINAIYLSRHLFKILQPGELKAVLTHELAHFHRYMRPLSRTRAALMVFNALLPMQLVNWNSATAAKMAILLWIVFSAGFIRLLGYWFHRHSRTLEFLCDYQAAQRYGVLNVINGLLAIVKTSEIGYVIQTRLLRAVRDDNQLSVAHLPALLEQIDRHLPDGPVSTAELERAIQQTLESDAANRLRQQLPPAKVKEKSRQIDTIIESFLMNRSFSVIDWSEFDNITPDGRIDAREYPAFIRVLVEQPDKQLFAVPADNAVYVANGSHPTLRERVLFLERCRQAGDPLELGTSATDL